MYTILDMGAEKKKMTGEFGERRGRKRKKGQRKKKQRMEGTW